MCYRLAGRGGHARSGRRGDEPAGRRLLTDGGTDEEDGAAADSSSDPEDDGTSGAENDGTTGAENDGTTGAEDDGTSADGGSDMGRPDQSEGRGERNDEGRDDVRPNDEDDGTTGPAGDPPDRSNVDVVDAGDAEPASPEWDRPDVDDIPEFEVRADEPVFESGGRVGAEGERDSSGHNVASPGDEADRTGTGPERGPGAGSDPSSPESTAGGDEPGRDPTAGRPNEARTPGATRVATEGTDAYLVALELCARLPDDVRLPEEAADLVPAAVEAELEQEIQSFAASEFDTPRPHVDTLSFEEVDDEIWLRIRIGVPAEAFVHVDPDAIRSFALQELEGVF
jgi:hypothetical protein